jgi:hypothetical protein
LLLSFGRPSESAACGEEVGEGAPPSGVVEGEDAGTDGVVGGAAVGVVCASGVGVAVVVGGAVAVGVGVAWDSAAGVGVIRGDAVAARVGVDAGEGVLPGCPADGAAGCCSQATRRMVAKAMGTMGYLFMPINTDAGSAGIFKPGLKGKGIRALCAIGGSQTVSPREIGLAQNSESFAGQD